MAALLIIIALALVGFLILYGRRSLPDTTRIQDPDRPDEDRLALQGLGILALMFLVMSAGLLLVTGADQIVASIVPNAFAR